MIIEHILLNLPEPIIRHWGYVLIFLFSLLETIPPMGAVIPGQVIVVLGGFLARLHFLNIGYLIIAVALGAILGDCVGYYLGRRFGHPFLKRYEKNFLFQKYYEKTKRLMHSHTGKTLIIGRFNPITRAFAPFIAGATNLEFPKFMIYNIVGGILWTISFVFLGYIFGESYKVASRYFGYFIVSALILSLLIIYLYRFMSTRKDLIKRKHLYSVLLNIISIYVFFSILEGVLKMSVNRIDIVVQNFITQLWNPLLTKIMIIITSIANPITMLVLCVILLAVFFHMKARYNSFLLIFTFTFGFLSQDIVKTLVHKIRPAEMLIYVDGYSFPSAHSLISIIFFSVLIYSFRDKIKVKWKRYVFICKCVLLFLLVGFSRIYLNVHLLSDVIAGFALGMFWLTFFILAFDFVIYMKNKRDNKR